MKRFKPRVLAFVNRRVVLIHIENVGRPGRKGEMASSILVFFVCFLFFFLILIQQLFITNMLDIKDYPWY